MTMMSTLNNGIFDKNILEEIGVQSPHAKVVEKTAQDKQDFLKLFMAQLKNQDPMQPQEGSDFLGQLAQFSAVEGIQSLKESFEGLAASLTSSQALQASSLVGKKVQINSDKGTVTDQKEGLSGTIELPRSVSELELYIVDSSGQQIDKINLGTHPAGEVEFAWNGTLSDGTKVPPGSYQIKAQAVVDGKAHAFKTYLFANVDSVTLTRGNEGIMLNVEGHGSLALSDVKKIA